MAENKIDYGLCNVHYATYKIENGVITYDTPIPIPGAINLVLDPRGEMTEFHADNVLYYSASNNQGYDGTLSIANIPEQFAIDALGEEKDVDDLVITEKANKVGKPFALMFQFEGDISATRVVLYNCIASRSKIGSSTKSNKTEPNEKELTFIASPRATDLAVKTKTTVGTPSSIYDAWFTNVYEKITA